jgi:hypothetical protein
LLVSFTKAQVLTTSPPKASATMTWPKMYSSISVETTEEDDEEDPKTF